jgi:hypothetical protein
VTQARIVYVTGMKPKPPPAAHRQELLRVLAAGLGRVDPKAAAWLLARPENFTLVSWTSLLYESIERDLALDLPGIERLLANPDPSPGDRREIDAVGRRLKRLWHLLGDSFPVLTSLVAAPALKVTLAEVRRYLHDRGGVSTRIRALLRRELLEAWNNGERVALIGHSLGSVIAYDTLWELSSAAPGKRVDLFMSLGSPLATRFIRKALKGAELEGRERYPGNIERWVNVAARGELVALHRRIAPFFGDMVRLGLVRSIEDHADLYNHFRGVVGLDVHKSYGYLVDRFVAGRIAEWLAAEPPDEPTRAEAVPRDSAARGLEPRAG